MIFVCGSHGDVPSICPRNELSIYVMGNRSRCNITFLLLWAAVSCTRITNSRRPALNRDGTSLFHISVATSQTSVTAEMTFFWISILLSLVDVCRRFGRTYTVLFYLFGSYSAYILAVKDIIRFTRTSVNLYQATRRLRQLYFSQSNSNFRF
jgi:hypothetical protein